MSRLRFGYISCQDYTNGYYNALYHLEKENVDYVVHLGDYTYETVASDSFQGGGPQERQFTFPDGGDEELTLRDYRFGYKKYKIDPNFAEAAREMRLHRDLGRPRVRQRRVSDQRPRFGRRSGR